jgi:hypothetical protein
MLYLLQFCWCLFRERGGEIFSDDIGSIAEKLINEDIQQIGKNIMDAKGKERKQKPEKENYIVHAAMSDW